MQCDDFECVNILVGFIDYCMNEMSFVQTAKWTSPEDDLM